MSKAKIIDWRKVTPEPLILVFGSEQFFSDSAIRRLKDQLKTSLESVEIYEVEAADYEAGELLEMVSPSLFSDPKLIIIKAVERATDALIEDGKRVIQEAYPEVTLVFQHSGTSTRGKALLDGIRGIETAVEVSCAKLQKDPEKSAFVQAHFQEANRKFTQAAVRSLVEAFGSDVSELAAACDQLMADSSEQIDEPLVDRYFGGRIEASSFKVFDIANEGRVGEALVLLRHALQTGEDPIKVITAFGTKLRQIGTMVGDPRASAASMGLDTWKFNLQKKSANGWDDDGISRALRLLAVADAAAKGAERQPEFRLEELVQTVAKRGRV